MTLDDGTLFIEHYTEIWNLWITSARHTSKHDLLPAWLSGRPTYGTSDVPDVERPLKGGDVL